MATAHHDDAPPQQEAPQDVGPLVNDRSDSESEPLATHSAASAFLRACLAFYQRFEDVLRQREPLAVVIAVIGLWFAAHQLYLYRTELEEQQVVRREERLLREATLYALLAERLDVAREKGDEQYTRSRSPIGISASPHHDLVELIQRMIALRMNLNGIDASGVALQNANLVGAEMMFANLATSNLHGATLFGANLSGSDPGADPPSSRASSTNAVSAACIAPSFVANASTVFLAGSSMSSAYHNVLLPLCQSREPPAQSRSTRTQPRA